MPSGVPLPAGIRAARSATSPEDVPAVPASFLPTTTLEGGWHRDTTRTFTCAIATQPYSPFGEEDIMAKTFAATGGPGGPPYCPRDGTKEIAVPPRGEQRFSENVFCHGRRVSETVFSLPSCGNDEDQEFNLWGEAFA